MTDKEAKELTSLQRQLIDAETLQSDPAGLKARWQGLTDEEIKDILDCGRPNLVNIKKAEQKLKEKNG